MPLVQINTWSIVLHPQKIQIEGRTWMTEALQLLVNFILLISFLFVHAQNKNKLFSSCVLNDLGLSF